MKKQEQVTNQNNQESEEGFPIQLILLLITIGCILIAFGLKIFGVF